MSEFLELGVNVFCELYSGMPGRLLSLQTHGEVTGASLLDGPFLAQVQPLWQIGPMCASGHLAHGAHS